MYYVNAISTISHQPTFGNTGFSKDIKPLDVNSDLIIPDYKKYIDAKLLRRMSKVIRMSLACSYDCLNQINNLEPEAIITGTGLGCLSDTQKFLEHYISTEGLLSPTAFIQSTHNSIAGQVSLLMKNHGYNMTHTQNNVSFEQALEDAMLCLDEGMSHVLVGAADEHIPFLEELNMTTEQLTSGATFLVLSKEKNEHTLAKVEVCKAYFNVQSNDHYVSGFFQENNLTYQDIDQVYYSNPFDAKEKSCALPVKNAVNLNELAGIYATNAAFGFHLGVDFIATNHAKRVLVCNNLTRNNAGFILLSSIK